MSSNLSKIIFKRSLTLILIIILILLAACSLLDKTQVPQEDSGQFILEGLVLSNETIFVTSSKPKDILSFELIIIDSNNDNESRSPGSLMEFVVSEEIRESYPMQATSISSKVINEKSQTITAHIDLADKIINHMPDDTVLIDVRTPEEFSNGHLASSINLPLDSLEELILEKVKDKDKTVLLYCRSGNRSATAASILKELDYSIVFDLGGINTYQGDLVQGEN